MSNAIILTPEHCATLTFSPSTAAPTATNTTAPLLLPGVRILAMATGPCHQREMAVQAVIERVDDDALWCRDLGLTTLDYHWEGPAMSRARSVDLVQLGASVSIPTAAVLATQPPQDRDNALAYLRARHPQVEPQHLDALVHLCHAIYVNEDDDDDAPENFDAEHLNHVLDQRPPTDAASGVVSLQLTNFSRDWVFDAEYTGLFQDEATIHVERFGVDSEGSEVTVIATTETGAYHLHFYCGAYSDEDANAAVQVNACFGDAAARDAALIAWLDKEATSVKHVVMAELRSIPDRYRTAILAELTASETVNA